MSYNFKDFDRQFPDEAACLHHIFRARFANHKCECGKSECFHRVAKRRCYAFCGTQLHPTAGTIFHKSETSLKSWFFAIFLFAKSKNGVSRKYLQNYVNEFAFRYNRRFHGCDVLGEMFSRTARTGLTPATTVGETST